MLRVPSPKALFIGIVAALFSMQCEAQDKLVTLEQNVQASHHLASGEAKAAVLLIHGWAGHMDEVGDLYKRLAHQLAAKGIASLRINIRGEGGQTSDKLTLTSTFATRIEDAQIGFNFLEQRYPNLAKGVVGFSLGGSTAIALAGQRADAIKSIVLWSSAGNPKDVGEHLFDEPQRQHILEHGSLVINSWTDITVTKQHLLGFNSPDILASFSQYKGALLTLRGTLDSIEDIDRTLIKQASGTLKESRYIAGADHIFNVLEPQSTFDERLLKQSTEWLATTL